MGQTRASILLVDDDPAKLVALEAVLEGLAEEVVKARSGREALRLVLAREFAVILLDVRMPSMDGFETAELIRQRKSSEHTPIIFITAYSEDELSGRGYALGAVDFITAPFREEVLRAKVSVFLDLFKKARQIKRQADALVRQTEQLHQLAEASLRINGSRSIGAMLDVAAHAARGLLAAEEAVALASPEADLSRPPPGLRPEVARFAVALPKGAEADRGRVLGEATAFTASLAATTLVAAVAAGADEPSRARLAVRLTGGDGRSIGWLAVAAQAPRAFSAAEESLLTQLGQVTSIALENLLASDAREANRLKDEFLATLSHELRTPLTAILGWVRLLRVAPDSREHVAHGLAVIDRNVAAQARLIDDLLDVSRIVTGKLRIDPGEAYPVAIVEDVVDGLRLGAEGRGVALSVFVDPSIGADEAISGDPDRLQQVVWNLVTNAVKFTPGGGHVEVRLDLENDRLRLRVIDDGRGISPAFLEHVFDRFRQADSTTTRTQGGLGIGLALVRHLVELHGGAVKAESPGEGLGSTFTVLLPRIPPRAPRVARRAVEPGFDLENLARTLEGLSILVVDDAPDAREVLGEILRRAGAVIRAVGSAEEALRELSGARFDVLVSDVGMPGEDGISLIGKVRALEAETVHRDLPAVAVTSYARGEDRRRSLEAGFSEHLSKPVEPLELVSTVVRLVRARGESVPAAKAAGGSNGSREGAEVAGRRVLIVEDDADSREGLKALLELSGHAVTLAGSGHEGLDRAIVDRPEVAIVDIGLPELGGYEVARRLRAHPNGESIYLIALTGQVGAAARTEALAAGFDAHVPKPVDIGRLERLLGEKPIRA